MHGRVEVVDVSQGGLVEEASCGVRRVGKGKRWCWGKSHSSPVLVVRPKAGGTCHTPRHPMCGEEEGERVVCTGRPGGGGERGVTENREGQGHSS